MLTDAAIFEQVTGLVVDTLGVEPSEVSADTLFVADLGGESLDMLDLKFRCERTFGVPVRFQDLTAQDLEISDDGSLTAASIQRLQERFPKLEAARWNGRAFNRPLELLTIGDISAIVASELDAGVQPSGCRATG